jgi:hypothetical protein
LKDQAKHVHSSSKSKRLKKLPMHSLHFFDKLQEGNDDILNWASALRLNMKGRTLKANKLPKVQ